LLIWKNKGFTDDKGIRHYPTSVLITSFTKPTAEYPSLLKHREVVSLFHELGHAVHSLVSQTKYAYFHGTSTARDFVETPSKMLENWCWTPSVLKTLSRHFSYVSPKYFNSWNKGDQSKAQPPEKLADELIDSLIKARFSSVGLDAMAQLHLSIYDLEIHQLKSQEVAKSLELSKKFNAMRKVLTKMDGMEVLGEDDDWGNYQAAWGHPVGAYDAGYYSYLLCNVHSDDLFAAGFEKDPMNTTEGRRYRHSLLQPGGSRPEMETIEAYLGRKPSTAAFFKKRGIRVSSL
jgi:metallopeptidase MepB